MALSIPSAKEIWELVKTGATLEAQEKIIALREAVLTVTEENHELRERVRTLEHQLEIRDLVFRDAAYWTLDDGGPYCQRCADVDGKLVRVHAKDKGVWKWYECYGCKTKAFYEGPVKDGPVTPAARTVPLIRG